MLLLSSLVLAGLAAGQLIGPVGPTTNLSLKTHECSILDYGAVEIAGMEPARVRYLGILVVEVAVGLAVAGAMVMIFDVLAGGDER